jgi:hypothetical protein
MTDLNRETIERFWAEIASWEAAYTFPGLCFFAIRHHEQLQLLHGRLFLHTAPPKIPHRHFESASAVAGYFPLAELGLTHRVLVEKIMASEPIHTPLGNLYLPLDSSNSPSTYFVPFHSEGISGGSRISVLMISGAQRYSYVQQPQLDWELKSAPLPFDSLGELLNEYSLGAYKGDFAHIEVVALAAVEADLASVVKGESAKPALFLANALNQAECHLGYRVLLHGQVMERGTIRGTDMEWAPGEHYMHGTGSLTIPSGAALQCFAAYRGFVHHQGWIADPALSQNPRRAALEEFDENLAVLRDFLFEEQKQRKDARDFEIGVAWLMWILGFSVAHAGATSRTSDATDILATTPGGHMALVECTTGHIKSDTKLAKLVERTRTIRRRLDASGNRHIRLLPVIVTALGRDEVKADLDQAQQLGVVVAAREELSEALTRSIMLQDADRIFSEAEDSLRSRQEQFNLQLPNA